jgi:hypothetical protein
MSGVDWISFAQELLDPEAADDTDDPTRLAPPGFTSSMTRTASASRRGSPPRTSDVFSSVDVDELGAGTSSISSAEPAQRRADAHELACRKQWVGGGAAMANVPEPALPRAATNARSVTPCLSPAASCCSAPGCWGRHSWRTGGSQRADPRPPDASPTASVRTPFVLVRSPSKGAIVGRTAMMRVPSALLGLLLLLAQGCATVPIASSDRDITVSEGW